MAKDRTTKKETTITVRGNKPVVVLGIDEWREIEQIIEDREDAFRYERAIKDADNQKSTSFQKVKKQLDLP